MAKLPCTYRIEGKKVYAKPIDPLPDNTQIAATLTTAIEGIGGEKLKQPYNWQFKTKKAIDTNWILWWGCDNDGEKPIIRPDGEDWNPYKLQTTWDGSAASTYLNNTKQAVGNGCLDMGYKVFDGTKIILKRTDDAPFSTTTSKVGFFLYPTEDTAAFSASLTDAGGGDHFFIKPFGYDRVNPPTLIIPYNIYVYFPNVPEPTLNMWNWIECWYDLDTEMCGFTINNVSQTQSCSGCRKTTNMAKIILPTPTLDAFSPWYLDQIMITNDITKDLYALRMLEKFPG